MNTNKPKSGATDTMQDLYKFAPYDSQLPIEIGEGKRLVKCLYKENKKTGKKAGVNSYIIVPESHLSESIMVENAVRLAPYVSAFMQEQEDKLIKEAHIKKTIGFSDTWLGLDKILESLDAAGQGNRLNKEKIEAWFNSDMQEPLIVAFASKMGISETPTDAELNKLIEITEVYKAKFSSLASGKTVYKKDEAELLQRALEVTGLGADSENSIGSKFYKRLEGMKNTTVNTLLAAL